MKNIENKKKYSNNNKIYFIAIVLIFFSFSSYIFYKYDNLMKYEQKIDEIKKNIDLETKKNEELKYQTEYKNSAEYIEKIARDKLGMVKNNEIIFYDNK